MTQENSLRVDVSPHFLMCIFRLNFYGTLKNSQNKSKVTRLLNISTLSCLICSAGVFII